MSALIWIEWFDLHFTRLLFANNSKIICQRSVNFSLANENNFFESLQFLSCRGFICVVKTTRPFLMASKRWKKTCLISSESALAAFRLLPSKNYYAFDDTFLSSRCYHWRRSRSFSVKQLATENTQFFKFIESVDRFCKMRTREMPSRSLYAF